MPKFSKTSLSRLNTCHPDIVKVCQELIKQYDFSVLEGYRDREAQEAAFYQGTSRVHYPNSAHNKTPSQAVDLAPYPIDWDHLARFTEMWTRFDTVANILRERGEIKSHFVWGGHWKSLKDYPHIEIKTGRL